MCICVHAYICIVKEVILFLRHWLTLDLSDLWLHNKLTRTHTHTHTHKHMHKSYLIILFILCVFFYLYRGLASNLYSFYSWCFCFVQYIIDSEHHSYRACSSRASQSIRIPYINMFASSSCDIYHTHKFEMYVCLHLSLCYAPTLSPTLRAAGLSLPPLRSPCDETLGILNI